MKNFKYVNLEGQNNYNILGIAYTPINNLKEKSNLIDILTIFKHDDYYSLASNYLHLPKSYSEKQIISTIIDNINIGTFQTQGTSISGTLEDITKEMLNLTGINNLTFKQI